jgi:hypothetical protein
MSRRDMSFVDRWKLRDNTVGVLRPVVLRKILLQNQWHWQRDNTRQVAGKDRWPVQTGIVWALGLYSQTPWRQRNITYSCSVGTRHEKCDKALKPLTVHFIIEIACCSNKPCIFLLSHYRYTRFISAKDEIQQNKGNRDKRKRDRRKRWKIYVKTKTQYNCETRQKCNKHWCGEKHKGVHNLFKKINKQVK